MNFQYKLQSNLSHTWRRLHLYCLRTRMLAIIAPILILLLAQGTTYAQTTHKVELEISARSGYSSVALRENTDSASSEASKYWDIAGNAALDYSLARKGRWVRSQARLRVRGTEQNKLFLELARAYIRSRIPLSANYSMQLEMGKNTLAWGEGDYYNAGDVIFGTAPNTHDLSSSNFRDYAFWQLRMLIPINSFSYFEPVFGIPDQQYLVDSATLLSVAAPTSIDQAGAGARLHIETGALQWEAGAYNRFVQKQIAPYVSLAIPLAIRIYIASSTTLDYSEVANKPIAQFAESASVSGGFLYTLGLNPGASLSIQPEVLYANYLTKVQLSIIWRLNRISALLARGEVTIEHEEYALLLGPSWELEEGFTISMYANISANVETQTDNNTIYAGGILALKYTY